MHVRGDTDTLLWYQMQPLAESFHSATPSSRESVLLPGALVSKHSDSAERDPFHAKEGTLTDLGLFVELPQVDSIHKYIKDLVPRWTPWTSRLPLRLPTPYRIPYYSFHLSPSAMRARVVPPYPSFSYVMSQIGDQPPANHPGSPPYGNAFVKPPPRPYSKYDDNPFMRTVRYDYEPARGGISAPATHSNGRSNLYPPPRSKSQMSLPLVGKFLQKHSSALSQRRKVSSAI